MRRFILPSVVTVLLAVIGAGALHAQQLLSRGITEPYRDATLSATVAGTIAVIRVTEGQAVRAGDVLLELENELEILEVERRKLIAESTVEVDASRSRLETLAIDLAGTRKLHEQTKSVSQEELQKKELEYRLAEAELQSQLVAEKREEIEYRIAQSQLKRRIFTAPFDGEVVELKVELGESCSQQQPLLRIVDTSKCRLVIYLEQAAAMKLKVGDHVTVRIQEAAGPLAMQGTVDFISPLVDASSGLRQVKVLFDNPGGTVHPGVTGTIVTGR